ncbi:MAG: putative diguanylate cyclase [Methanoregulaceae archaeon PtaU1.Bin222]|nr:MAG: putative diguanylate cyclase [Methanoregulaceae archaeon PtaU1.Bin222]
MISVLYVDDESPLLDLARIFMERTGGFRVITSTSAKEALESESIASVDAIISDYQMPEMDGIGFLKEVRKRYRDIPFILFTGRGREEVVIAAINNGADFYLQKGGDPKAQFAELTHKVMHAVRRRQTEISLRESEQRYRDVVETQTEFISRFLPDGTHVFANEAYCRHFGKTRNEIVGHTFIPPVPEEDQELVRRHFQSFSAENPVGSIEHRVIMPDGSIRWHWWNDHAFFDTNGRIVEFQSVGKDITDRKQFEEDLKRSENLYRTIFSTTGAATIITAPDTTILLANQGWENLTGVLRADQENKLSWTIFFNKDDVEMMARRQDPSLAPPVYESRLIDVTGNCHHCMVHVHMIPGTKNSVASLVDITDLKNAENALYRNEERYRSIINDQTEMICRFRPDGTVTFTNDSYRQYFHFGSTTADIEGKNIEDLMLKGPYQRVDDFLLGLTPETPIREMDIPVKNREGELEWQHWSARVFCDSSGTPVEYQVVGRDITEQKRYSAALSDSESRLRSIIEMTTDSISLVDEEGRVIEWNPGSERISGIRKEDALGRYLWDLTYSMVPRESRTEDRRAGIERSIRTMFTTGEPVFKEPMIIEAERPDGSRIFTRQVIFPIKTGKGYRIASIAHDITDEQRSAAAIKESEAKYRELADLLPMMVFELDLEFRVTYANRNALSTLGFTEKDLMEGIRAIDFIDKADQGRVRENVQKSLQGIPIEPQEYTGLRKDGTRFPILIYSSPIFRDGSPIGFRGVIIDITEWKHLGNRLMESEQRFRGIAERSSDLIFILGQSMSPTYVSSSSRSIVGYDPGELTGKSPEFAMATIFQRSGPELMNAVNATMEGHTVENVEIQLTKKDGTPVYVSVHAIPVMNEGVLEGVQVTMRDITPAKNAEIALRESEAKYRLLAENVHDMIWTADPGMNLTYISPSVLVLRGYSVEEAMAQPLSEALTPESLQVFERSRLEGLEAVQNGRTDPQHQYLELEFRCRDGSTVWTETVITPAIDREGILTGVVGVTRDISWRRKAELALRDSEQKFSTVFRSSPVSLTLVSAKDGICVDVNDAFVRESGYSREDVIGRIASEIGLFADPSEADQVFTILKSHGQVKNMEIRFRTKSGEIQTCLFSASIIHMGNDMFVLSGVENITPRKSMENALRLANRQLNLLGGITRHDILNKVSIILGYVEIAKEEVSEPSILDYLKKIEAATRAIQSQIDFTRMYKDLGTRQPQWIALASAIPYHHVPSHISLKVDIKGIDLNADPMLEKVFYNLLDNSIRHGERVTEIHVSSLMSGQNLAVVWEDNGIGIPADEKEKIFERGYGKNTGLGMFLVREILSLTGITIQETGEPGKGVRFEMIVPRGGFRSSRELP